MESLLRILLAEEHSKNQKDLITAEIIGGKIEIEELIQIIESDFGIYSQRGAYVITGIQDQKPELLAPFIHRLFSAASQKRHQSIPRATFRYLASIGIPEDIEGEVLEHAFSIFKKKSTPIAIKAHLMCIMTNLAYKYPELKTEVQSCILVQLPEGSAGYKSRAKKELKKLNQIVKKE